MKASQITVDDLPAHTAKAKGYLIAQSTPARQEDAQRLLEAWEFRDGRSEFKWLLLANGDLCLAVYPQGAMYEEIVQRLKKQRNPLIVGT